MFNHCSLFDQGAITKKNVKSFDESNYTQRRRFGEGSISGTKKTRSNTEFACYKLVGAEFVEDVIQMMSLRGRN